MEHDYDASDVNCGTEPTYQQMRRFYADDFLHADRNVLLALIDGPKTAFEIRQLTLHSDKTIRGALADLWATEMVRPTGNVWAIHPRFNGRLAVGHWSRV